MPDNPDSLKHPFLDVVDDLDNRYIREAKSDGKRAVGYFCGYVPRELLDVDDLVPYRARAPYTTATEQADVYLGVFNCSYTRCVLETMLDDGLDFIDGYVFTASCDHLRRVYDNWRYLKKPDLCHMMDIPHKTHDDAVDFFTEEFEMLRDQVEKSLGVKIDDEQLAKSIRRTNELRQIVGNIQELRKRDEPALTGEEMQRIMVAVGSTPAEVAIEQLQEIYSQLEERETPIKHRARLLVMGSHMDDPAYLAAMEEMGGLVVADTFCTGAVQFTEPVDENEPPLKALARRYLRKMSCPRMFEAFNDRYKQVVDKTREFNADGIVIQTMKFCDTWGIDSQLFVNRLRDEGIETLKIEREYTRGGVGQLRTRVQAFIEMLGK